MGYCSSQEVPPVPRLRRHKPQWCHAHHDNSLSRGFIRSASLLHLKRVPYAYLRLQVTWIWKRGPFIWARNFKYTYTYIDIYTYRDICCCFSCFCFNVFCSVLQCQRIQNFATWNSLPEIISNSDSAHCQQLIMSFYIYHVIWQWTRAHHLLKNLIFGTPTCFINWYLKNCRQTEG